jgi:NAD(P)-dependent dehydrogenase (short-subunit alcohol dehydrogenase family)
MTNLTGKVAIVTGAAGGLGLAMAQALAAAGADVALLDVQAEAVASAAASIPDGRGAGFAVDIRDRQAVAKVIDSIAAEKGRIDCLINNAAAFHYAPLEDMPEDAVNRLIDVGIKGTIWSIQAALPHLKVNGGSIINLSSIAVFFSIRNAAVYSAIKGANDAMTRQLAGELGPFGIRVNALAPGSVQTPGASSVIDAAGWDKRTAISPLKRLVTPEDVGNAAVFLASDAAASITGITLKVDAGMTIVGP